MSDIVPNVINPRLPDAFFAAVLGASAELSALVGDRYAPARDGFEPSELLVDGADESEAWPYVLFGPNPSRRERYDQYAQTPTLLESPCLIVAIMREDIALLRGEHYEDATARIQMALQEAFSAVTALEVLDEDGNVLGVVSGCEELAPYRVSVGKRGTRESRMGLYLTLVCN